VLGLTLLALFTVAITVNLARGRVLIDCGCGGASGQKLSRGLVVRNFLMMLGLALAWAAPQWLAEGDRSTGPMTIGAMVIGVGGASLALTVLYFAANQLMTNFQALRTLGTRTLR
jgi:hypothetical protein